MAAKGFPIKGDLNVTRTGYFQRVTEFLRQATITTQETLDENSAKWQRLSAATTQDCILPSATTLEKGWSITVEASGAATIGLKTYDVSTPVLLQNIASSEVYSFTLLDNATAAGIWNIARLLPSNAHVSLRYIHVFNATTDWGTPSNGYYLITLPAATHGKGTNPLYQVSETSGSKQIFTLPDEEAYNNSNGDITVTVPETPDGRFAGKIVVI
jgi:hypothetical protein